ncbi:MAG: hypothetical protein P4M14_03480 [Gammaproteobacteria bacterium]|nr:hypothetical protein [Gammaproteobacteria bacterium]
MQDLQSRLVNALLVIKPYIDTERTERVINVIDTVTIPPNDYEKVAGFICLFVNEEPGILTAQPFDQPLKELCLDCFAKMPDSPKPRAKP